MLHAGGRWSEAIAKLLVLLLMRLWSHIVFNHLSMVIGCDMTGKVAVPSLVV